MIIDDNRCVAGALAHDPAEDRGAGDQERNTGVATIPYLRGENKCAWMKLRCRTRFLFSARLPSLRYSNTVSSSLF